MDDAAVAGLTITTVTLGLAMFDRVLPPAHTIHDRAPTPAAIAHVQTGCLRAAPVALGIGIGASLIARTPWPAIGSLAVVAWMWWQYDLAAKAGTLPASITTGPIGRYGR